MKRWLRAVGLLAGLMLSACNAVSAAVTAPPMPMQDEAEIKALAMRWAVAAAVHDGSSLALLSGPSREYYPSLQQLALHADATTLQGLEPIEQLQVLFLRLMLEPQSLQAMSEQQLLAFALQRGLIGQDLRASDALREIAIAGDTAQGRLYKFGRDDWPDRSLQYFVREEGGWRVDLRGELERLRSDFDAFLARSHLSTAEAAFFILETRLMRKVTPADFVAPLAVQNSGAQVKQTAHGNGSGVTGAHAPVLRVVAIRRALDEPGESAAILEDREESLRYVLGPGDTLPAYPDYTLTEIDSNTVVVNAGTAHSTLRLESGAAPLGQRLPPVHDAGTHSGKSLLQLAEEGSQREGMMAQWRNVGLRDRAQLLQQAWLTADYTASSDSPKTMTGLRVRKLVEGSFWHQLGLQEGDLLEEINGVRVDSLDAWQQVIQIAQNDTDITITVDRAAHKHRYRTETIRPR
jgi:type II secretory pathway component PulC